MRSTFILFYFLIGYYTSINIPDVTGIHLLFAIIISSVIGNIVDFFIYNLAFFIAGKFKDTLWLDKNETSCVHWAVRSVIALCWLLMAQQSFMADLILYLTVRSYNVSSIEYQDIMNQIISAFTTGIIT